MKNKQFAALPFRIEAAQLSILLITTRRQAAPPDRELRQPARRTALSAAMMHVTMRHALDPLHV